MPGGGHAETAPAAYCGGGCCDGGENLCGGCCFRGRPPFPVGEGFRRAPLTKPFPVADPPLPPVSRDGPVEPNAGRNRRDSSSSCRCRCSSSCRCHFSASSRGGGEPQELDDAKRTFSSLFAALAARRARAASRGRTDDDDDDDDEEEEEGRPSEVDRVVFVESADGTW